MNSHWTPQNFHIKSDHVHYSRRSRKEPTDYCVSGFYNEYLWVSFDLSAEIWWGHMSLYYGGVGTNIQIHRQRSDLVKLLKQNAHLITNNN